MRTPSPFATVLENVVMDVGSQCQDLDDGSVSNNTRDA